MPSIMHGCIYLSILRTLHSFFTPATPLGGCGSHFQFLAVRCHVSIVLLLSWSIFLTFLLTATFPSRCNGQLQILYFYCHAHWWVWHQLDAIYAQFLNIQTTFSTLQFTHTTYSGFYCIFYTFYFYCHAPFYVWQQYGISRNILKL